MRGRARIAAAAAGLSLLFGSAGAGATPRATTSATPAATRIALVYRGRDLSRRELKRDAAVLSYQANSQFRRFWPGARISIRVVRASAPAGWPEVDLVSSRPPWRTGGYHYRDRSGRPVAVVYLRKWHSNWPVGVSHEMLEMLVDPAGEAISSNYLEEICDPVQFTWYRLRGLYVADFVTPAWYTAGPRPWDIAGRLHAPRSFDRGGEEDYHRRGRWVWIGPGTHLKRLPRPVKVRRLRR